ncbi:MAG: CGNR zinc finger domain-containing protein [Gaiellales bacterium]
MPDPRTPLRLDEFVELRVAVRELLHAAVHREPPQPAALDLVNHRSSAAPLAPQLDWPATAEPSLWRSSAGGDAVDATLAAVARSVIELLGGPDRERLRACPAPGCGRFFVARDPRRLWCSSRGCGNRVRVARHAARRRAARDSGSDRPDSAPGAGEGPHGSPSP